MSRISPLSSPFSQLRQSAPSRGLAAPPPAVLSPFLRELHKHDGGMVTKLVPPEVTTENFIQTLPFLEMFLRCMDWWIYFQYGQDPLLRQLSEQTRENYDLPPPASRGDPLLRQLVRNGDYKVVNLEPPRPLTNTFDTLRKAVRKEIFRSIFIKLFKL